MDNGNDVIVQAIRDLTKVTIALAGGFESKAEAIRRLDDMAIPSNRIAAILDIPTKDVASVLSRRKRK